MSSIDERIVEMRFNNSQFEKGIKQTTNSLDDLAKALKLDGLGDGLEKIGQKVDSFNLDGIEQGVQKVADKFNWFTPVAVTAIAKVTDWALDQGKKIADFVWQPLIDGGKTRSLNLEQARFQFQNLGLDVEQMMTAVSNSVNDTAYSLDQAAVAASNFAASQVPMERMELTLRAVAGTAAMSGAEYSRVADIFTKVAGQGRLMGDDINRFGAIGINIAAKMAEQWGITEAEVRKMATEGQISFAMLADAADSAFGASAFKSNELYTGSLANLRAAISRIGASYFDGIDPIHGMTGVLTQQRDIFNAIRPRVNDLHNALKPLIQLFIDMNQVKADGIINFMNNLDLTDFTGGMKGLADGLRNLFNFLQQIKGAFTDAFALVFKPSNAQILTTLGEGFANLTSKLTLSDRAVNMLKTAFTAILSVFKFVWETLVDVGKVLWALMQIAGEVFSFIFEVIGEVIKAFTGIEEGTGDGTEGVLGFFEALTDLREKGIQPVLDWLEKAREKISNFLDGIDVQGKVQSIVQWFKDIGDSVSEHIGPLEKYGENFLSFWKGVWEVLKKIWEFIAPILGDFTTWASDMAGKIGEFLSSLTMDDVLAVVNTGVLLSFIVLIAKVVGYFKDISDIAKSAKDLIDNVSKTFTSLQDTLKTFQNSLKVDMFLKIAIGVALLAAAIGFLAMQDQGSLWSAMGVVAAIAAVLVGILYLLDKIVDEKNIVQLQSGANTLVTLAWAIGIISAAIFLMGKLEWEDIAQGLTGLAGALAALVVPLLILAKAGPATTKASGSIVVMAIGLALLSGSVWLFAQMDWDTMIRGLTGVGLALLGLSGALMGLGKFGAGAEKTAAGMLTIAVALAAIAGIVYVFGTMDTAILTQGLIIAGSVLAALVAAGLLLSKLGPNALVASTGVLALAGAVAIIAAAVYILGEMDGGALLGATIAIAAIIGVLVLAVNAVAKSLPAIPGVLLLAAAVLVLAGAVWVVGQLDAGSIIAASLAIALLVGVITAAVVALGSVPQAMVGALALSAVIFAIGASVAMAGAGAMMFVGALWLLGPAGESAAKGIEALGNVAEKVFGQLGMMLALAGTLLLFGLGAAVAGIGVGILGAGFLILGLALGLLAITAVTGATALQYLANRLVEMSEYSDKLLKMGVVLGALGSGLLLAGAGALIAGTGFILMGTGMALLMQVGPAGVKVLTNIVKQIAGLTDYVGPLLVMTATLGALGLALLPLGTAMLMGGTGAILFAAGLTLIMNAISNPMFIENLTKLIELIPVFLENVANGIVAFSEIIASNAQTIADALLLPVNAFLTGLQETIPLAGIVIGLLIDEFFVQLNASTQGFIDWGVNTILAISAAVVTTGPQLAADFMTLVTNILNELTARMPELATAGGNFIIALVQGVGEQSYRIITAAGETLLKFVNELSTWISNNKWRFSNAATNLVNSIVDAISVAVGAAIGNIWSLGERIGRNLVAGAMGGLDAHSPSREFIKIMGFVFSGMESGEDKYGSRATATGEAIGENLLGGMKESIKHASKVLDSDIDLIPTIRPVLDLSDVKKGAAQIDGLITPSNIVPSRTSREASDLETYYRMQREEEARTTSVEEDTNVTNFNYTQNINSPKAISESEVYRNTNNQLSKKKKELTNA